MGGQSASSGRSDTRRLNGPPWAIIVPAALIALALLAVGNYALFISPRGAGIDYTERDYMNVWAGARAVLDGVEPHDEAVWHPLRARYGAEWMPNPVAPHPLWTYILFAPLALLNIGASVALWLALSEAALLASLALLFGAYGRFRPGPVDLGMLLVGGLVSRWVILLVHNGQMSALLLLAVALFAVLLMRGRDGWAGIALAFLTLKPSPFLIFIPLIGVWLITNRRWRAVAGGLAAVAGLAVVSLAVRPGWVSGWLGVRTMTAMTIKTPTVWGIATDLLGSYGLLVALVVTAVVMAGLGFWLVRRRPDAVDATAVALCASLAVTPYIWPYDHLLLMFPLAVIYVRLRRTNQWAANLTWLAACFALPWGLYWVANRRGVDTLSVLVPVVVGVIYVAVMGRPRERSAP